MVPVALVVIAAISQELGAALAVTRRSARSARSSSGWRSRRWFSVWRCDPRFAGLSRRAWVAALGLAAALAVMNTCFYFAIARIPLGIAVTLEVLGPLILSVVVSVRRTAWLWALLAFAGVALLGFSQRRLGDIDAMGVLFAAAAAVAWAAYIVASARAGAALPRLDGLALATALGALVIAPFALASIDPPAALHWDVVGLALVVGLMSSVIPYSLELLSLRRLSAETFAVLMSISPVTAAVAGWLVLGQQLGVQGYLAIVLVSVACVEAVRSAHRSGTITN